MRSSSKLHPDICEVLYSEDALKERIEKIGAQITRDYADSNGIVVVTILRGAAIFAADLVRAIDLPVEMDFMAVSSYGASVESSGSVKVVKDLSSDIEGKDVIIVEDILDTGITLSYLLEMLGERNPKSMVIAALLKKEGAQKRDVSCEYVGFTCPDAFIVGYGLDYAQHYRNLPYIGILDPSVYSNK